MKTDVIELNVKDVAKNALDNWDKLGAVNNFTECKYSYGSGICCVIGISIPEDHLIKFNYNESSVNTLIGENLIKTDKKTTLQNMQWKHDQIAGSVQYDKKIKDFKNYLKRIARG